MQWQPADTGRWPWTRVLGIFILANYGFGLEIVSHLHKSWGAPLCLTLHQLEQSDCTKHLWALILRKPSATCVSVCLRTSSVVTVFPAEQTGNLDDLFYIVTHPSVLWKTKLKELTSQWQLHCATCLIISLALNCAQMKLSRENQIEEKESTR